MERQMFVSVFGGVGAALAVMLVSLGLVQVLDVGSPWAMVAAGALVAVIVGTVSLVVREMGQSLVKR